MYVYVGVSVYMGVEACICLRDAYFSDIQSSTLTQGQSKASCRLSPAFWINVLPYQDSQAGLIVF